MWFKFLLLILLFLPEVASAAYCCFPRQLPGWWASADYLLVWRKKRFYPPLVTTSPPGTLPGDAGVLGLPTTSILFGDDTYGNSPKSGGSFDLGIWMNSCVGIGGGGFGLAEESVKFSISGDSNGDPILARPFRFVQTGAQTSGLFSFPGLNVDGFIDINARNRIWGADFYGKYRFLCSGCGQLDLLCGFMFTRIDDDLKIFNRTRQLPMGFEGVLVQIDNFDADDNFYGGLVGFNAQLRGDCWGVQAIGKVGIGGIYNKVTVSGNGTFTNDAGDVTAFEGGFLALPTNIGTDTQRRFSVVPQFSGSVQYRLWCAAWLKVGYELIYWPRVALAGEQIDLTLNATQMEGNPLIGPAAPVLDIKDKSFWMQGLSVGFYASF